MLKRVFGTIGIVILAIGAYDAFSAGRMGMALLLGLGAIAVAIPIFLDPK